MKIRRIKRFQGENRLVWFGSYGMDDDGYALFYNENDPHDNFSEEKEMVADCLTQWLSTVKSELWFDIKFGLPLTENLSKIEMDMSVAEIVMSYEYVNSIISLNSKVDGVRYACDLVLDTKFGPLELSI